MIIERIVSNDDLEKFYNHDLALSDLVSRSWNKGIFKISEGFKTIKIEIPEKDEEK